ncbi:hypothetical protein [Endozoicomonas arenosclerae]|uniref:hypothetical protein n=1 Tax=Endozoicomonas arenosclerae TaxID=1633495 RepID=UPI000780C8D7|nr:hypothetical protein [Endozoicomonas arenosclerae]
MILLTTSIAALAVESESLSVTSPATSPVVSPTPSANAGYIYEKAFCGGNPCVDLTILGESFTFLINTCEYYTVAESEVINLLSSQPTEVEVKDFEGRAAKLSFYKPATMRLGGVKPLRSSYPIASQEVGGYKKHHGISGILGARDMMGLIWDIDYENQRLRVWKSFNESNESFDVRTSIQGVGLASKPLPSTQVTLAKHTFILELELLEPEDIQINHNFIKILEEASAIEIKGSRILGRFFENGYKSGAQYTMTEGKQDTTVGGYNYHNIFTVMAGYDQHIGRGFFSRQKRVVIDLKSNQLWIVPNPEFDNCLAESGTNDSD